jgi:hypothetical protein
MTRKNTTKLQTCDWCNVQAEELFNLHVASILFDISGAVIVDSLCEACSDIYLEAAK